MCVLHLQIRAGWDRVADVDGGEAGRLDRGADALTLTQRRLRMLKVWLPLLPLRHPAAREAIMMPSIES